MSDDHTPDPMDKAYAQAERLLGDEAERAARRARVLAAVARAEAPALPIRRTALRRGGWLVAASVVGVSVLVATQVYPPPRVPQPASPPPAAPATAAPAVPAIVAPPAPTVGTPRPERRTAAAAPSAAPPKASDIAAPPPERAPPPPAPLPPPPLSAAAPAPPAVQHRIEEPAPPPPIAQAFKAPRAAAAQPSAEVSETVVVTGEKRSSAQALAREIEAASPEDRAARLRDAASAGRTDELKALLARRVPVDAADDDGETALMKAVQENQPGAAGLLRRRGASLDLKNHAGVSARDMAKSAGDAKLDRALGLPP